MNKNEISLHLVDDSTIEIEGHLALYNLYDYINVVKTSANGLEALRWEEGNNSDVMVVDLCMPVFDGLELMKYLKRHKMPKKVIIYSGLVTANLLSDLIDLGVKAYVLKNESLESQLIPAINQVYNGGSYFSEYVLSVLNEIKPEIKPVKKIEVSDKILSKQEAQVLDLLLSEQNSDMEDGALLSKKVITDVMRRVRDKYDVANNIALIKKLIKR